MLLAWLRVHLSDVSVLVLAPDSQEGRDFLAMAFAAWAQHFLRSCAARRVHAAAVLRDALVLWRRSSCASSHLEPDTPDTRTSIYLFVFLCV